VGEPVTWTYAVRNAGNVTLTAVTVVDDRGVAISCPRSTLAAGEAMSCTASGAAVAGQYVNTGWVTGTPVVGPDVVAEDVSHYFGIDPRLDIEKHTNGEDADIPPGPTVVAGDPVTWTYLVSNTGNVTVTGIAVTDDQGIAVSCPWLSLAPHDSMTCTATASASLGPYENLGTVVATFGDATISDSDPSQYRGVLIFYLPLIGRSYAGASAVHLAFGFPPRPALLGGTPAAGTSSSMALYGRAVPHRDGPLWAPAMTWIFEGLDLWWSSSSRLAPVGE
jgi:hypothetical protein